MNPQFFENLTTSYRIDGDSSCPGGVPAAASPACDSFNYGWSISSSSVDPSVNQGALPIGLGTLYLWLDCTEVDGMTAVEFGLQDSPELTLLGLTPLNGALNAGTAHEPLLAVGGCPTDDFTIATLLVFYSGPVSIESETWSDVKAMYR